jgi:hypothetical protein
MCDTVCGKAVGIGQIRIRPTHLMQVILPEFHYIIFRGNTSGSPMYRSVCVDLPVEAHGDSLKKAKKSLCRALFYYAQSTLIINNGDRVDTYKAIKEKIESGRDILKNEYASYVAVEDKNLVIANQKYKRRMFLGSFEIFKNALKLCLWMPLKPKTYYSSYRKSYEISVSGRVPLIAFFTNVLSRWFN